MFYKSTRNSEVKVSSAQAIAQGISEDGGLFVPSEIPAITLDDIKSLGEKSYAERAFFVFSKYLTDFTEAEIRYCVEGAYNTKNFDTDNIAELAHLFDGTYMLELWHGPTCAFKDMALQILPYLLTTSIKKLGVDKKVVILVATSGDTGKAALEGFKDVADAVNATHGELFITANNRYGNGRLWFEYILSHFLSPKLITRFAEKPQGFLYRSVRKTE